MYNIFYNDLLIGHSKLEMGDPPMGVAHGEFIPTVNFNSTKDQFEKLEKELWRLEGLVLKTGQGKEIECHAGTVILIYESLETPFALEFSGLGIDHKVYKLHFPHHVKNYKQQWDN